MFRGSSWILIASLVLTQTSAYHQEDHRTLADADICIGKETCNKCIQTPLCAWCSAPRFEGPTCYLYGNTTSTTSTHAECSGEFIYNPDNKLMILRSDELTSKSEASSSNAYSSADSDPSNLTISSGNSTNPKNVQLTPQEIKLELRVRRPYNISFSYSQATKFPVDVYYLSNFRQSTENGSNNNVSIQLGEVLAEFMKNLTSNYRLGFGATVTNSSAGGNGFHNIISLSQDTRGFMDAVHNVSFYPNPNAFEEGLDAILQAIVCQNEIGWRSVSRKILVFLTDTEFPQDNNNTILNNARIENDYEYMCRLNERGLSAFSSNQLIHPSISLINQTARKNQINIVWVVTDEQYDKFRRLSLDVEGSFVVRLTNDSTTITDLIKNSYQAISMSIEMKDNSDSNVMKVRYFSKCLVDVALSETSICTGLKFGDEVQFIAEIEATSCPKNETEWNQVFSIHPVGVDESLNVNLRTICNCDCEHPGHPLYELESATCLGSGTLKCGVCECDNHHYGSQCECVTSEFGRLTSLESTDLHCKPDNTTSAVCSGRGSCICGVCECEVRPNAEEIISGRFCECDNFSCDRYKGRICSDHGVCDCGECRCDVGWSGSACHRQTSTTTCISPIADAGISCSGHGDCIFGICVCHAYGVTRYSGRFCDVIV